MKCLIIDSDKKSRLSIKKFLNESAQLKQVFTCQTVQQAYHTALEHELDFVVVNFAKPGDNGIGFLEHLPYSRPQVIVTSKNKQVAKDAFDHAAVDFLLKPVQSIRLMKALARVIKMEDITQANIRSHDNLYVKIEGAIVKIATKDIYLAEVSSDYLKISTDEKTYTVYSKLKRLMEKLSKKDFIRVHRSFVVRIDRISSIEDNTIKVDGRLVPLSRTYRRDLMDRLKVL
jgi:two-component system, LytTR family, response regulator